MLSIKWITGVDYYLKKKGKRRAGDGPDDDDDPDDSDEAGLDYYFDIGEGVGEWWGDGAKLLSLYGTVKPADLQALCQGFSPDGRPLIQNAGAEDHQQAWDLTFSAVKSLSVLWSQVETPTRLKLEALHRRAVSAALGYLAEVAVITRRGKGGVILEPALPIVAIFGDTTSRELEPQLHSHCLLLNVAGRIDGTFGTILSQPFYRHKLTAGAIYQTELAHLLRSELGLKLEQEGTAFRIVGVPEKLIDHYSTRSKQIRERLRSKGHHSAKAAAVAALDTRKAKPESPPSFSELLQRWQATNRQFGFTPQAAERLFGRTVSQLNISTLEKRLAESMRELLINESFFSEQTLIRQAARVIMAEGIAAGDLIKLVRAFLVESPEVVPLAAKEGEPLFTTQEILSLEKEMLTAIDQGKTSKSHVVKHQIVERVLSDKLPLHVDLTDDERTRNEEQRAAILKVTARAGSVQVIEGMAGTGKTYTLNVARQIWSKAGFRVIGMAISAAAAANLQGGAAIDSETIAMRLAQLEGDYAAHHKRQLKRLLTGKRTYAYRGPKFRINSKTIVVVDEAAMVGTRQFAEIVRQVNKAGAKLVLVGDRRQLQPIEAGGPFAAIADRTDKAELNHVVRQKVEPDDPNPTWHRQAGQLIAAGHVAHAMKLFAERGRLSVLPERDLAMLSLVRDWSVKGIANPTDHIVLAGTRDEVQSLNYQCQSARLAAGALGTDHVQIDDQSIHLADIVLFTKNARVLGVNNGDRGVVLGFNRFIKNMAVQIERTNRTVFIPYRSYTDVQLGYAMTTHKAQGATVPSVYVLLGGAMQDRHLSYVQTTRACESTRLYVDKCHAGPDLKHLLNQMAKERPKQLAHDHLPPRRPPAKPKPATAKPTKPRPAPLPQKVRAPKGVDKTPPPPPQQAIHKSQTAPRTPPASKPAEPVSNKPPSAPAPTTLSFDPAQFEELLARLKEQAMTAAQRAARQPRIKDETSASAQADAATPVPSTDAVGSVATRAEAAVPSVVDLWAAFSSRNLLDLAHVRVTGVTDRSMLDAAVARYGRLPGGIVVEGEAGCNFPIASLAFNGGSHLILNQSHPFDTGLSAEEIALLWQAVLETNQAAVNFGVLSQTEAIGVDDDTLVAHTMMTADNAAGGIVYGHDSTWTLCRSGVASYRNPYVDEVWSAQWPATIQTLALNYLDGLGLKLFLKVAGARFAGDSGGAVRVAATSIQAAIGIILADGQLASPGDPIAVLNIADRFPYVQRAFDHFVKHFADHARSDPTLARTIAYAELVLLLRHARTQRARLLGVDHVRRILAGRRRYPQPRLNYTQRSAGFVGSTADIARYLARRTDGNSFDSLATALVALRLANLAGDFASFVGCKKAAVRCIRHLASHDLDADAASLYRQLHSSFAVLLDRISNYPHDALINNCIEAALQPTRTVEERSAYLADALRWCGTDAEMDQCPATRCCWLEVKSHLDSRFDPVPGLAQARVANPALWMSFSALNRINRTRNGTTVKGQSREQLQRAIDELRRQSSNAISTRWLHAENPFAGSHALLDFESAAGLDFLFSAARQSVERFTSPASKTWWPQFLKDNSCNPRTDASKAALLVAYELRVRGLCAGDLYDAMRLKQLSHPQAALLRLDLDKEESRQA